MNGPLTWRRTLWGTTRPAGKRYAYCEGSPARLHLVASKWGLTARHLHSQANRARLPPIEEADGISTPAEMSDEPRMNATRGVKTSLHLHVGGAFYRVNTPAAYQLPISLPSLADMQLDRLQPDIS